MSGCPVGPAAVRRGSLGDATRESSCSVETRKELFTLGENDGPATGR